MCTFISTLPRQSTTIIGAKKKNMAGELFLRECKDSKTYYRVRLVGFSSKAGRDDPHITRYVHTAWETDPSTGKKRLTKVVCPTTPWVNVEGNKASSCKICNYSNQQFSIYSDSGKSDKNACRKAYAAKKTFEAIIPVYVITDPNYDKNAGKFKVIIMNDPKEFAAFREKITAQQRIANPFNGNNAVDCVIHVSAETNENGYKRHFIDKIKFTTEPYDLPAINSQNIDAFPFDDTFFVSPDPEEIDEFYDKHCAMSNNDIPDDDDIPVYSAKPTVQTTSFKVPQNTTNQSINVSNDDISTNDLDDLIGTPPKSVETKLIDEPILSDTDEVGLVEKPITNVSNNDDSDDILASLGI